MTGQVLRVEGLRKAYGDKVVLAGVDLTVERHEQHVLELDQNLASDLAPLLVREQEALAAGVGREECEREAREGRRSPAPAAHRGEPSADGSLRLRA